MAEAPPVSRNNVLLLVFLVLAGFGVRLAASRAEFWLDEIWSWEFSRMASTPWDIFLRLRHDNNHILNTLVLWLWPAGQPWWLYRMHSVVAGSLAIVAAWSFGGRFGRRTGLLAAFLTATCPWFVWSSAEARGYGFVVLCTFLAADALYLALTGRRRWAVVFWAISILGVLSHPTFLHASAGFFAWSWAAAMRERSVQQGMRSFAWIQGPVITAFAVLGLTVFAHRVTGGAPPTPLVGVMLRLLAVAFGGPEGAALGAPWILAALAGGLAILRKRADPAAWLFVVTSVCMPLFVVLIQRPVFLFERYLFVALALAIVPMSLGIERAAVMFGAAREKLAMAMILLVMFCGHAWHITNFLRSGRGDFIGAARWILAHDNRVSIAVTGDLPLRVQKYVRFYAPYLNTPEHAVVYVPPVKDVADDVQWLLIERMPGESLPGPSMRDSIGGVYVREWASPASGIGSWGWAVYHRKPAAP